MMLANGKMRFTSKLDAFKAAEPVWCCMSCRMKHDAPMVAQCKSCSHTQNAMKTIPGKRRNTICSHCFKPGLENKRVKPLSCIKCNGVVFQYFHSTTEFNVFAELAMLQDHGKIEDLKVQVKFPIRYKGDKKPITTYIADMTFYRVNADGSKTRHVVDVKGDKKAIDGLFKLKKALVEKHYPGTIIEIITQ